MRLLVKTLGWMLLSGLIIFISNLSAGVTPWNALIGSVYAKIGTTIVYFFYEFYFERSWHRKPTTTIIETLEVIDATEEAAFKAAA